MYNRPRCFPRAVAVAALLLAFAPYAAQAEKRVDGEETDHSNQDLGRPDADKVPRPGGGGPGNWGGPKSDPGLGEPGGALDPLLIRGLEFPYIGDLANRLDANEFLLPILTAPDRRLVLPTPPGAGERLVDWSRPLAGWDGWPELGGIGSTDWGPPAPIPEPGTLSLLLLGGVLVAAGRRRGG